MDSLQQNQKRKRRAVKGFLILILILLLCVFLSGTLRTLSTANVYTVIPTYGRLKENINASGILSFTETEGYPQISLPEDVALTISHVYAAPGLKVSEGDLLAEAHISNLSKLQASLEETYEGEAKRLAALQLDNASIRITNREENWIKAYDIYLEKQKALLQTQTDLQCAAESMGVSLTADMNLPDASKEENLLNLYRDMIKAQELLGTAQAALERANRQGYSQSVVNYIFEEREIQGKMAQIREELAQLQLLNERVMEIRVPHDGYVLQVNIQEEESWSGNHDMMIISSDNSTPVLHVDIEEVQRTVPVGNAVSIQGRYGGIIAGRIDRLGIDSRGNALAEIDLKTSDLSLIGNISELLAQGVSVTIPLEAETESILIPASAVRGSGNNRYVYELDESENLLGQQIYSAKKATVHVIEAAEQMVAVSDDLRMDIQVIYMEDRGISDGTEVIPVGNER